MSTGCRSRQHVPEAGGLPGRYPRPARGPGTARPVRQRDLLDAYGGLGEKLDAYGQARRAHESLRRQSAGAHRFGDARRRERALLEFERDELAAAEPEPGEYDELAARRSCSRNADQIRSGRGRDTPALRSRPLGAGALTRVARTLEPLSAPRRSSPWPSRRSSASPTRRGSRLQPARSWPRTGTTTPRGSK